MSSKLTSTLSGKLSKALSTLALLTLFIGLTYSPKFPSKIGSVSISIFSPISPIKNVFFSACLGHVVLPFSLLKSNPYTLGSSNI